ncbi:hypothetical protein Q9L58_004177 [Maublancomyces gigas]|uniref:Uncharacterized protein n=1 Tax=Discina gigas TaxID=1032678 RepID=A0ABR3GLM4_9PEZI
MSKSGPSTGNNRQTDFPAMSDRPPHDFGCPASKRVYSLNEIEQNFNIRSTIFGNTSGPGPDGRPPNTPFRTATPDSARPEFKLDCRLLHEAITRSCTGLQGGLPQDTINEQVTAAVILMGMDERGGVSYEPTLADIRYHEYCCGGVVGPGEPREEIMADVQLVHEAIEQDKKTKPNLSFGKAAGRHGGRVTSTLGASFTDVGMRQ